MKVEFIANLSRQAVTNIVTSIGKQNSPDAKSNGLPTQMVFAPNDAFTGSMHYMLIAPNSEQRFHYHPTTRYLLVIGDVDICLDHSPCNINTCPEDSSELIVIPANTLAAIRFQADYWHKFSTKSNGNLGVAAFTFHENDMLTDPKTVTPQLMEQETIYWEG